MKHRKSTILFSVLAILMLIGMAQSYEYYTSQEYNQTFHDGFSINNTLTIKIDGKVVYYNPHDTISFQFYQYNFCKIFNDSNSCQQAGVGGIGLVAYGANANANGCRTYNSAGTINQPNAFTSSTRCSATAVFLSNDTSAITNSQQAALLPTYYLGDGLAPVKAVTSYTAPTSNSITLTASWTTTKAVNGVDKVSIGLWNDKNNAFVDTSNPSTRPLITLTGDLFTPQSIPASQSFQVIFAIGM